MGQYIRPYSNAPGTVHLPSKAIAHCKKCHHPISIHKKLFNEGLFCSQCNKLCEKY